MKISIVGLGWLGETLAKDLSQEHEVSGTSRTQNKIHEFNKLGIFTEHLTSPFPASHQMMDADVIVLNIPPFHEQLEWFKSWPWNPKTHLIFISSTSVYGELKGEVNESTLPQPDTSNAELLIKEEKWVKTFPFYTILRCGGLIGLERHPGKNLSGRIGLAGGNSPVNLIHLHDVIGFIKLVIDKKISGEVFNLVSPEHPTRREFYSSYCKEKDLALPEFIDQEPSGKIVSSLKAQSLYEFKIKLRNA